MRVLLVAQWHGLCIERKPNYVRYLTYREFLRIKLLIERGCAGTVEPLHINLIRSETHFVLTQESVG